MKQFLFPIFLSLLLFFSCKQDESIQTPLKNTYIDSLTVNGRRLYNGGILYNVPTDTVEVYIKFSNKINRSKLDPSGFFISNGIDTSFIFLNDTDTRALHFRIRKPLLKYNSYRLSIAVGEQLGVNLIDNYRFTFVTQLDSTPKFPLISDDSLLTLVQRRTFNYFWDYAHPVSGLARERYGSGETVTTGGTGFGIMAILVGINRGFIQREEGFERINKIVNFLNNSADKFHGAFPHWLNGTTGKVLAFSQKDNGADLVETAFLVQGLLTAQQYFIRGNADERAMCYAIQNLWEGVEWDWFRQNNQQKLFWHWSPNYGWDMNMPISGWNEGLIVYVLAAASPTHPIPAEVYLQGWTRNGAFRNGRSFYNITLPLGEDRGGPMFFSHYSFLGLNPARISDEYTSYLEQNVAHARINYSYCVANPKSYMGYSKDCWGLTASDIPGGYTASSPTNDGGTIAPTAALASMPYTPTESLQALRFFYYVIGDKTFGEYGFKDAFNLNKHWFADSYLAIDQGPIVIMIENYRTGFLWQLFMQNNEVMDGLKKLGFTIK